MKAGERAPDAAACLGGQEARLMQVCAGPRFHLLMFGGAEEDCWPLFAPLAEAVRGRYRGLVELVWIGVQESPVPDAHGEPYLVDHTEELHHDYAATEPSVYLLRPDGYVAYRSQTLAVGELDAYFAKWRRPG